MWANTVIASQGDTYGLVLYTGKDTRSSLNGKNPRSKFGKLDLEINRLSKILFLTMCFIALLIIIVDGFVGQWYFKYFRCVLLLCAIIIINYYCVVTIIIIQIIQKEEYKKKCKNI